MVLLALEQLSSIITINQTFTITPKTGYHIVDVLVNATSVGAVSSYTLSNINASVTIKAIYQANPTATSLTNPNSNTLSNSNPNSNAI